MPYMIVKENVLNMQENASSNYQLFIPFFPLSSAFILVKYSDYTVFITKLYIRAE